MIRFVLHQLCFLILLAFVASGSTLLAQEAGDGHPGEVFLDTEHLDSLLHQIPNSSKNKLSKFVSAVDQIANNDYEKVYLYYTFIGENFKYDLNKAKNIEKNGVKRILAPSELFKSKKGVCGDYSYLLKSMCDSGHVTSRVVMGTAKTKLHPVFLKKNKLNHAWNAVKVNENWYLLDVTWGMKLYTDKRMNRKEVSYRYFFMDPEKFALSHYPADPNWQLLNHPNDWKAFKWNKTSGNGSEYAFEDTLNYRLMMNYEDELFKSALSAFYFDPKNRHLVYRLLYLPINDHLDKKKQEVTVEELQTVQKMYQQILVHYLSQNSKKSDRTASYLKKEVVKYEKMISKRSDK